MYAQRETHANGLAFFDLVPYLVTMLMWLVNCGPRFNDVTVQIERDPCVIYEVIHYHGVVPSS